ncbi:hypothetical protein [Lentilactobacillus kefiri]|nr:hypothetical protein [Lentilactobacillus kefiri]
MNINLRKLFLCILSSMAVVLFLTSGAVSASTKTYRDHHDNAVVTVHKRAGKVTSVVYQLKHANKYKKRYQKRSRFYTKVSVINSKTAKLIRKNYKGTVTFNDKMRYYGHLYASEQTTPIKGMTGDATDAIFMNVAYYGKNPQKYHNALLSFGYWWNTMDDTPKGNPEGNVIVFKNGRVSFSDDLYSKLPD